MEIENDIFLCKVHHFSVYPVWRGFPISQIKTLEFVIDCSFNWGKYKLFSIRNIY